MKVMVALLVLGAGLAVLRTGSRWLQRRIHHPVLLRLALIALGVCIGSCWGLLAQAQTDTATRVIGQVINRDGKPVPGATIRVCTNAATYTSGGVQIACTPLATVYTNTTGTVSPTNPITADGTGNYSFYAAPGKYCVQYSGFGLSLYTVCDYPVFTVGSAEAPAAEDQPVDVGVTFNGKPTASLVLVRHPFPFAVTIPQDCTHSYFVIETPPSSTWTGSLQKNNVEFGTVSCTAATPSVCSFTCASATSFAEGDVLKLIAPGSADGTAALIGGTIYGTRAGGTE